MDLLVRAATPSDVPAVRDFGETHIRPHYTPLIGAAAADAQVRDWWNEAHLARAVADGLIVVADPGGPLAGVAQRGGDVIYKLYVAPGHRGHGLGPRLIDALVAQLPAGTDRVHIEHFAANTRAAAFYDREGFTVDRVDPSPTGDPALAVVWRSRRR
jgi:GNAT superfamily N-acetyltransferase